MADPVPFLLPGHAVSPVGGNCYKLAKGGVGELPAATSSDDRIIFKNAKGKKTYQCSFEDVIGAHRLGDTSTVEVVMLVCKRRLLKPDPRKRKLRRYVCRFASVDIASQFCSAVEALLRLPFPEGASRRLCVVLNPHGGRGRAVTTFERQLEPLLRLSNLLYDVHETQYAGHAVVLGQSYDPAKYTGVIFVSGDGTVQEFVSGILSRPDWRIMVRRVPICSIACGTANVLSVGLRTTQPEYAVWVIVKQKVRPLDAMLVSNAEGVRTVAVCGVGWGLAASIAMDSETYRHLGIFRYAFLKLIHGFTVGVGLRRFVGKVEYSADVAMDDVALATYFSKPLATGRRLTKDGLIEIAPLDDNDRTIADMEVSVESIERFTLKPGEAVAASAMKSVEGAVLHRGGGRLLGRDSMVDFPDLDVGGGIVTATARNPPSTTNAGTGIEQESKQDAAENRVVEEKIDAAIVTTGAGSGTDEAAPLRENGGFGTLEPCTIGCARCQEHGQLRFVGQSTTGITFPDNSQPESRSSNTQLTAEERYQLDVSRFTADTRTFPGSEGAAEHAVGDDRNAATLSTSTCNTRHSPALLVDQAGVVKSSVAARGFEKRSVAGTFVTVGAVNVGPDGRFTHPSDSYVDLIIAKRGGMGSTMGLLGRYILRPCKCTDERDSDLLEYVKARTIVITPDPQAGPEGQAANVDGEVLAGPGPFRIHLMPSLLTAFGEI